MDESRQARRATFGRDAIAGQAQAYMTAVPDCVLDVRGLIEQGDTATLEWTYRGTHTGDIPVSRRAAVTSGSPE